MDAASPLGYKQSVAPFVGRTDELQTLEEHWSHALNGRHRLTLLVGEPGLGKSRLLTETVRRLGPPRTFQISGHEPERSVSLSSSLLFLKALTEAPEDGPALKEILRGSAGAFEPIQLFEVAHRCLDELSPALIVVDDAQWVDPTSTALCRYLIQASEEPSMFLAASRPLLEAIERFSTLTDDPDLTRVIRLGPLDEPEVRELAAALRPNLEPTDATRLWERSAGSPFWVEALASPTSADSVADLVTARTWGLGSDPVEILRLLAILGRPLDLDEGAEILAWEPPRIRKACDDLIRHGLASFERGSYRIAHDLIREALWVQIPESVRRKMHGSISEAGMRQTDDPVRLQEALEHRRAAGLECLDLALRLARSPARRSLDTETLELLASIASQGGEGALELRAAVASIASESEAHSLALRSWAELADRLPTPAERSRAALEAAKAAIHLERDAEAGSLIDKARDLSGDDEILTVLIDATDAEFQRWNLNRLGDADRLTEKALVAARSLVARAGGSDATREAHLAALRVAFESAFIADEPQFSLELTEEMVEAAADSDEEYLRAAYDNAVCLSWLGRSAEAHTRLQMVFEESQSKVIPELTAESGYTLAGMLHDLGQPREALDLAQRCLTMGQRLGKEIRPGRSNSLLYLFIATLGRWQEAVKGLETEIAAEDNPHPRIGLHQLAAEILAKVEGPKVAERVRDLMRSAMADRMETGCRRCGRELLLRGVEITALIGDTRQAEKWLEEADLDPQPDNPSTVWLRDAVEALLVAGRGDHETAGERLKRATDEARRLGLLSEAFWFAIYHARSLENLDRPSAIRAFEEVAAGAENYGYELQRRIAARELRRLGVRTWRRGPGADSLPLERLTERELEVAQLVAAGSSNPEIAAALFLSRKTIERHVSNVLAKLGLRNRAQLASALSDAHRAKGEGAPR